MALLTARTALLVNPVARRAQGTLDSVMRAFAAAGVAPQVAHTRCAGDGERAARELAQGIDRLFVLGGDGTVMEAVTGLVQEGSPASIGILPGGTGNQLARALGIPLSPARAVGALLAGDERRIDLGVLNGHRRVGIGAGIGLDAAMIAGARGRLKRWVGVGSYLVSAARAAWSPPRFAIRAEVDGRVIEREGAIAMVLNMGCVFNGLLEVAPGSSLVDGQLDLVIVDARGLGDAVAFSVSEMLLKRRIQDRRWTFARGESITIESLDTTVPAQVDGDLIDDRTLSLRVDAGAGRVLVPAGVRII